MLPELHRDVHAALVELQRELQRMYGERLVKAVLYGSHARGAAGPESDVDVLVVLKDPVDDYWEIRRLVSLSMDLWDRYDLDIHLMPFGERLFLDRAHPLMMNVYDEAIDLLSLGAR
jgi:uncharacterized protein